MSGPDRSARPDEAARLYLHITSTPSGEAPPWVREQWVGLSLPLAQRRSAPADFLVSGVTSGPKSFFATLFALVTGRLQRQRGYAVETDRAMAALAAHRPHALAWWQEHTPHVMRPGRYFVFDREAGHVGSIEAPTVGSKSAP